MIFRNSGNEIFKYRNSRNGRSLEGLILPPVSHCLSRPKIALDGICSRSRGRQEIARRWTLCQGSVLHGLAFSIILIGRVSCLRKTLVASGLLMKLPSPPPHTWIASYRRKGSSGGWLLRYEQHKQIAVIVR
jgi:hypothetical protein